MREFISIVWSLFDRQTRAKLIEALIGSAALAIFEAAAITLVGPLLLLLTATSSSSPPPHLARLVMRVLGAPTPGRAAALLAAILLTAFLAKAVAAFFHLRRNIGIVLNAEATIARRLFRAYLSAPYAMYLRRNTAELQRLLNESVRRVFQDSMTLVVGAASDSVIILAITILLFVVDPSTAACAVSFFALVGVVYHRYYSRRGEAIGKALADQWSQSYKTVQQTLRAVKEVHLIHREDFFATRFYNTRKETSQRQRSLLMLLYFPRYYLDVCLALAVAILSVALFTRRSPDQAISALGLFLAAGFRVLPSLNRVFVAQSHVRASLSPLREISGDLRELDTTPDFDSSVSAPSSPPSLEVANLEFSYPDSSQLVLQGVAFTVSPGDFISIVGKSGAGKSTLVDLILGLLDPSGGNILVGGKLMTDCRDAWQLSIGYVPQDVTLLDDTIRANIAFACDSSSVDEDAVLRACEAAQLRDLIDSLPNGLDTVVGENGVRLSGGQRQRTGLARALYRDPCFLVLDEATSAIDVATEARFLDTLESLRGTVSIVMVTHRINAVRKCDNILLIEAGRLIGSGSFEELARSSEIFQCLLQPAQIDLNMGTSSESECDPQSLLPHPSQALEHSSATFSSSEMTSGGVTSCPPVK